MSSDCLQGASSGAEMASDCLPHLWMIPDGLPHQVRARTAMKQRAAKTERAVAGTTERAEAPKAKESVNHPTVNHPTVNHPTQTLAQLQEEFRTLGGTGAVPSASEPHVRKGNGWGFFSKRQPAGSAQNDATTPASSSSSGEEAPGTRSARRGTARSTRRGTARSARRASARASARDPQHATPSGKIPPYQPSTGWTARFGSLDQAKYLVGRAAAVAGDTTTGDAVNVRPPPSTTNRRVSLIAS